MTVVLTAELTVDPATWDAGAMRMNGTAFHCHAWGDYRSRLSGSTPLYFTWRAEENRLAALAVGWMRRPVPGISIVELDAAPLRSAEIDGDLRGSLVDWTRSRRATELHLGSFGFADTYPPYEGDGDTRVEFLVEPGDSESLRSRMSKRMRRYLSVTRELGVQATVGHESDVGQFVALHAETLQRLRIAKGVASSFDGEALADALRFLVRCDRARFYLARHENAPICGCVFACFGRSAYYVLYGANEAGRAMRATAYLLNFALADLSAAGYTSLNLGGTPGSASSPDSADHGLYRFKSSMGGVSTLCPPDSRLTLRPLRAAGFQLARRLLRR